LLTDRIDTSVLEAVGPGLKVVSNFAIGVDNVDIDAATERGVLVCNTPGVLTETTADLAFALLLAGARRLVEAADFVKQGRWKTWGPELLLGHDVHGATLGIIGLGAIGAAVARRAAGFGMTLLYHGPNRKRGVEESLGIEASSLVSLLERSDFVSLHAPLTPETQGLINAETLRLMKRTSVLVNTSRGGLVDTGALIAALEAHDIAFAALDVTDPEPIPAGHKLLELDNCLVVPHIGSASEATRLRMAMIAADNLLAALSGDRPKHLVNPEALDRQNHQ